MPLVLTDLHVNFNKYILQIEILRSVDFLGIE